MHPREFFRFFRISCSMFNEKICSKVDPVKTCANFPTFSDIFKCASYETFFGVLVFGSFAYNTLGYKLIILSFTYDFFWLRY